MGSDPERTFSGPEREYIKETYDVMLGTFKDYAEMIIQVYCIRRWRFVAPCECHWLLCIKDHTGNTLSNIELQRSSTGACAAT